MKEILQTKSQRIGIKTMSDEEKEKLKKLIEEEDRQLAEEAHQSYIRLGKEKVTRLFDENSLINKDLQKASFDNYEPNTNSKSALELTKRYADIFNMDKPRNLLLYGNYGTGKSHLSVAITKNLMEKGYTCLFISMPKLLSKIRTTYNKNSQQSESDLMQYLEDVDLLVLDDIGAEKDNEWSISKLFEIVDGRIGKHTIYTTNFEPSELRKKIGERNFSRVMQNTYEVKMIGEDYRLRRG